MSEKLKMKASSLVRLTGIEKTYLMGEMTVSALRGIDLSINAGEYVAILGPSGSGKSTLMNVLGCLDAPTKGQYLLNNNDVSHLTSNELALIRNQQIGFIFQSFNLLESLDALDNVALPLVYRGIRQKERKTRAKQMLSEVGLGDRLHHKPNELSGGQRQRVAIARALVTDPSVILADEPTGNLDTQSGEEVINIFEQLVQQGKTVIIVTHDNELAERTHRVLRIRDGLIESDSVGLSLNR